MTSRADTGNLDEMHISIALVEYGHDMTYGSSKFFNTVGCRIPKLPNLIDLPFKLTKMDAAWPVRKVGSVVMRPLISL